MGSRFFDQPDEQAKKSKRGRPPGSRNKSRGPAEGIPRIDADEDLTQDAGGQAAREPEDSDPETRTICGMAFSTRKQGTFPPPIVIKVALAVRNRDLNNRDFVRALAAAGTSLGENQLYTWVHNAGEPRSFQAYKIAQALDIDLKYLMDDEVPAQNPPPRSPEATDDRMRYGMDLLDITAEDVERYLPLVAAAKQMGIARPEATKILLDGYAERQALKAAGAIPGQSGTGVRYGKTSAEGRAEDAARDRENGPRNGHPKIG